MGSLVLVGRCYLSRDLEDLRRGTQSAPYRRLCISSMPVRAPFLPSAMTPSRISAAARRCYAAAATFLLLRKGSYTSPLTHSRCSNTASFRATAITARFLAFLPPRLQILCPALLRSLSFPCGPNM